MRGGCVERNCDERSVYLEMMVWIRQIIWRKLKSPVLSKTSLRGKAKKFCVSKQMLKIYVGCFISLVANSFSITMLFPFLPFMVQFLLPELKEDEESIGKYAGIIVASMFLGRFFGSYVWGAVADRKGRKPVIIASCLLLGLFSTAFGFSIHFAMAVIFRFGVGLMNGVIGTAKAVISDVSDDSNQAFGIGVVSCAVGMGYIIGPAISGAIADPIGQYNLTVSNTAIRGFLTKFPYSLPCILNLILSLLGVAATVCLVPETLGMKKNKKRDKVLDEKESNEQEASSSSEDIAESASNGETDSTALDTALGDGSHCADVDLGTLGRRPFAMREDDSTGSKTGEIEEVDQGESGSGDTCKTDTDTSRAKTRKKLKRVKSQRSARKEHRWSSFLIPAFQRHDSFTPSIVKPSQSDLHQKAAQKSVRRKLGASEGAIQQAAFTLEESQQEEIKIPEGLSGGVSGRETLLEDTVGVDELSWTRRVLKRVGLSIKCSLYDLRHFLCTRTSFLSILSFCMFSFTVIGYEQIYSVWAATPPYLGGLGFPLHDIGLSMAAVGVFLLPFSLVMFPVLERCFGAIKTFYISCIPMMVIIILLPNLHYLVGQRVLLWFLLILMVLLLRISMVISFGCLTFFINNSVTFDKLGAVNGLAVSLSDLFRTVAPLFSGGVFSASLSEITRAIRFPLDSHLIFLIFGAVFLGTLLIVACLPQSINRQKIVE